MHRVSRRVVLGAPAAAAAGASVASAAPAAPGELSTEALGEALRMGDGWLSAQCAYDGVPEMCASVVARGREAWSARYGGSAEAEPVFPIGSLSKLFTAVAAMSLVEEGRLELDAPAWAKLPWISPAVAAAGGRPITLRSLLCHGSGLPRDAGPCWTPPDFRFPSRAELRAAVNAARPTDPPLARFAYSNMGYALIGEMVESAAGRPYAEVVQTRVLDRLGLGDTHPGLGDAARRQRIPPGWSARRRDGSRDRLPLVDVRSYTPAAGFTSTARDLTAFATWVLELQRTGGGPVLKSATLAEMLRPQLPGDSEARVGLGFILPRRGGAALVGHDGEIPGYRSNLWMHPESRTAAVVLRTTSDGQGPYAFGLLGLLRARSLASPAGEGGVDLAPYAGRYGERPWWGEGVVGPWAGRLAYLSVPTGSPGDEVATFAPTSPDVFRRVRADGSLAEEVVMRRDGSGRVTGFMQHANLHPRIG